MTDTKQTLLTDEQVNEGLRLHGLSVDKPSQNADCFRVGMRYAARILPAASESEPLVRYCPGCGSIGSVEGKYRDCCPDGNEARMIPQTLAEKCRDTFKEAVKSMRVNAAANDASEAGAVPVAGLVRYRNHLQGTDQFHEWGDWYPVTLAHGKAVTDPGRNTPEQYQMRLLYASPPAPVEAGAAPFDMVAHLARQREWSERTFGPGARTKGVVDHIRKELCEIESDPGDLKEWIDVVILALDGAWRSGADPLQIVTAIVAKQTKNEGRQWPDWRTADPDKAIEHDRCADAAPSDAPAQQEDLRPPMCRISGVSEGVLRRAATAWHTAPAKPDDEQAKQAARYRWLRDKNDWYAEPRLDEADGTVWKLTFYTSARIEDPTDDDNLDAAVDAAGAGKAE